MCVGSSSKALTTNGSISGERSSRDSSGAVVRCSSLRRLLRVGVVMFSAVLSDSAKGIKVVSGLGGFLGIQGCHYMVEVGSYFPNLSYQILVSPSQFHLHIFDGQ